MIWLKRLLFIIIGLAALLVCVGLVLPDQARVERSIVIQRPATHVFAVLNGFSRFNAWSPWAMLDPKTRYRFEGAAEGVGAKMSWVSDDPTVGQGSQEILAAVPNSNIKLRLQFGPNKAEANYDIQDTPGGVQLTWTLVSDFGWDIAGRYFGLFFDRTVGADFDRGLARLKALVEQLPAENYADLKIERTMLEPMKIAYVSGSTANDPKAIEAAFALAVGELNSFIQLSGIQQAGQPLAISRAINADKYEFDVAIPVDRSDVPVTGNVRFGQTFAGPALRVAHTGPYDTVASVYPKINAFLAVHQLRSSGRTWEQYMSDPAATPANQILTYVFVPLTP
jgi:effector-binding domain-containing protein